MKRIILLTLILFMLLGTKAQIQVNDSTYLFLDSIFMNLPEVMVTGERPIVKSEQGKLVYDLPRIVSDLPVDNAYDAIKELPGIMDTNDRLTLAGTSVNIVIDGKVSTMSAEQLTELLKTIPVSRIESAEVMHAAPARYQVRGPMVNLVLKKNSGESNLTGEVYSLWRQKYYEQLTERASLLYSSPKFSADLLYSFNHSRIFDGTDKEALHTVGTTVYPMDLLEERRYKSNRNNVRLGMDYTFSPGNILSFVYTTQFSCSDNKSTTTGTQNSTTDRKGNNQLHDFQLDYRSSFGLSAGAEFTFYQAPVDQYVRSAQAEEQISAHYDEKQRINKWRFYATQEHSLPNDWSLNYGANYTTAVDNSFQKYYDLETGEYFPDLSMQARRREYTANAFAGFSKSFGKKLSVDASMAAELYHTDAWDEWMFYPTLNVNYVPTAGHMFQLSFSSDKKYPEFWSINNAVSYLSTYSEIHGNPQLKPSADYNLNLTYILKSKYVFRIDFSQTPDYFVQTLYQATDRLTEIYKTVNFDYRRDIGFMAIIPFKAGKWLNSRVTFAGYHMREKDSDFWDIPFDRSATSFITTMTNTFNLSAKPNIKLTLTGFYQNGAIQGLYNIRRSGYVDAALRWTSDNNKAQLTLKGTDLLDTQLMTTDIRFETQHVTNRYTQNNRGLELSFSYKFGDYKEKKREAVDTSRFK